jgi:pyridoxal/pyridoxine/pyridoxamine kinase
VESLSLNINEGSIKNQIVCGSVGKREAELPLLSEHTRMNMPTMQMSSKLYFAKTEEGIPEVLNTNSN